MQMMFRPTNYLRRKLSFGGFIIQQMWVNDNHTAWEWRELAYVAFETPDRGEGPPPITGINKDTQ